jgi:hypothetical protein
MNYQRWCEMTDEEAERILRQRDRLDFWGQVGFVAVGIGLLAAGVVFGMWFWD